MIVAKLSEFFSLFESSLELKNFGIFLFKKSVFLIETFGKSIKKSYLSFRSVTIFRKHFQPKLSEEITVCWALCRAALPVFAPIPTVLPGFSIQFKTTFSSVQAKTNTTFQEITNSPSAFIVISLTIFDFFLLHLMQLPIRNFLPLGVKSPYRFEVPGKCWPPTQCVLV